MTAHRQNRATHISVVGKLMVVPDGDTGHLGMHRLQVKVLAVLPAAWLAAVLPVPMILVKAAPMLCQKPHATT
jgi:hypothetical protein